MLSRIYCRISFVTALPRCFPKASAKVRQILELTNNSKLFFEKNKLFLSTFSTGADFQRLAKTGKIGIFGEFYNRGTQSDKNYFQCIEKNAQQPSFFTKQPHHYPLKNRNSSVLVHKNRGILVFRHLLSLLGEQLLQFMRIKIQGKLAVARHRDTACLLGNNDCNGIGNLGHTHCRAMT